MTQSLSVVTLLQCPGEIALDPDPIAAIYADMGAAMAEETICRALEDLARRLNDLQDCQRAGRLGDMVRPAARLAAIAEQIGLTEVAMAACHVSDCAHAADAVALDATLSRLERGFDQAITQIWEFRAS